MRTTPASSTPARLVEEAMREGLVPEEKDIPSGYAGVTEVKGKYQARFYDKSRKKQRALPGLHATPLSAAIALARLKRYQAVADAEGEPFDIPSPAKRKTRRSPCMMACAMAVPLEGASPRLPLVSVLPVGVSMVGRESVAAMCTAYTPPLPWEVAM